MWGSIGLILLGVVLWGGFNTAMEATNTLSFCISCHEMHDNVYQEYKTSIHFSNPSGVQAACPDCHVPREWIPKIIRKIQTSNEVYHWLKGTIDTKEKFEARRPQLAEHVWKVMKETDSRECRNCHNFSVMDLKGQARFAARIHKDAMEQGKTCIDCHKGIAHHLPKTYTTRAEKPKYNPEDAEDIMEICAACHGIYGQGTPDGEYPRLAGMNPAYLAKQLEAFKARKPSHIEVVEEAATQQEGFDALGRLEESKRTLNIPHYPGNPDAGGATVPQGVCYLSWQEGRGQPGSDHSHAHGATQQIYT